MQLTRDQARNAFASAGLTYDDLTPEALKRLRTLVGDCMKTSGCIRGSFRASQRFSSKKTPYGVFHSLKCQSTYFTGREAISFNTDGFIGFAGWADEKNVQPILRGFMAWVSELAASKGAEHQGEQSPTDKAERKRRLAAERQAKRRRSLPPEVRGIYAPADMHEKIKAFAKGLSKRRT